MRYMNKRTRLISDQARDIYATMPRKITDIILTNAWEGQECCILGGGPSLITSGAEQLIKGKKSIGINLSFLKYTTDIVYIGDVKLYKWIMTGMMDKHLKAPVKEKWLSFTGIRCLLCPITKHQIGQEVFVVRRYTGPEGSSKYIETGIRPGTNSGFGAIMLAIVLGVKKINLLGYDFSYDQGVAWHAGYPGDNIKKKKENNKEYIAEMEEWAPWISGMGVNMVNLNENSALRCFYHPMNTNAPVGH